MRITETVTFPTSSPRQFRIDLDEDELQAIKDLVGRCPIDGVMRQQLYEDLELATI